MARIVFSDAQLGMNRTVVYAASNALPAPIGIPLCNPRVANLRTALISLLRIGAGDLANVSACDHGMCVECLDVRVEEAEVFCLACLVAVHTEMGCVVSGVRHTVVRVNNKMHGGEEGAGIKLRNT
jgi:hypothetical protein